MIKREKEEKKLPPDNYMDETPANKKVSLSSIFTGIIIFFTAGYLLFSILRSINVIDMSRIEAFNTVFISIQKAVLKIQTLEKLPQVILQIMECNCKTVLL